MSDSYSISSISNNMQNLRNYEYMLYGGKNYGTSAPSYYNNYMGSTSYSDYSTTYPYGNYSYATTSNTSFNGYGNSTATSVNTGSATTGSSYGSGVTASSGTSNASFQGLSNDDLNALKNYYNKGLSPSESLGSSVISGLTMAATMNNPRVIAHLPNTIMATSSTNKIFAACKKEGTALYNLWRSKETNGLMQDFYAAVNKLEARNFSKIGAFRKRYSTEDYNTLKTLVDEAIASGDKTKIAETTAKLKNAYVTDGWLAKLFKKNTKTVTEAINDTEAISQMSSQLLQQTQERSFKEILSNGAGVKGGLAMMAFEMLTSVGKIKTAFSKDTETGMKQIGQTAVKSAGNQVGWMLGDAAAVWAMGKWGAKIGSMFGPGVGTIIGAVAGTIGGSLGMCLMGKVTRALVGQDVAEQVETDNLASTAEGQQKLVQYALEKAQKGEKMDDQTQRAVQNVLSYNA